MREDLSGNRELIQNNYRWCLKKTWLHSQLFNCYGKNMPTWVGYCKTLSARRCFKPEWIKPTINLKETLNVLLWMSPSWLLHQGSIWRSCRLKTPKATLGLNAQPLQNTREHTIYSVSGRGSVKYNVNHNYKEKEMHQYKVFMEICLGISWHCFCLISPKSLVLRLSN